LLTPFQSGHRLQLPLGNALEGAPGNVPEDRVRRARERSESKPSALCREFKITRPTAYKWIGRFKKHGYSGLEDQSRRPHSAPYATAEDVVVAIVEARVKHPRWGAKKLANLLRAQFGELTPSESTIERVLRRFGKLRQRRKKRPLSVVEKAPQVSAREPNDVWTIDFKGWWRAGNGQRCEPLTIRDAASRYILAVTLMERCTAEHVRAVMTKIFRRYGLPKAIQCDNGTPFVCVRSRGGLSALSSWWISLGIRIVRSRPGHPQDNGGHERMHVDLAADVQAQPAASFALQQRACDRWRQVFNHVRPHDALGGKTPGDVYRASPTKPRMRVPTYPAHFVVRLVYRAGMIKIDHEPYFIGRSLAGHRIGLERLGGLRHRVWFYDLDLGELEVAHLRERSLTALIEGSTYV
jgi:transposase InsO family protein